MLLSSSREVTTGAVAVEPPPEDASAPTPHRSTEFDDRNELLSGLAPPGRKSPAPAKGASK
jgi:hypothetical protein